MLVIISDERLHLLAQRAVYWPARRMLIVADIHFGKAASFRAKGVPVPQGTTTANLDALDGLLAEHDIGHVLFLGDFLHARAAHAPATLDAIRRWRTRYPSLALTLVRGNHDSHAGDPPTDLAMEVVDEPHRIGPFAFCHHPQTCSDAYVLAGHLHPVYRLAAAGDALRLPCFVLGEHCGLLPAFGAFTGGHAVSPKHGEQIFVAADDDVFRIPSRSTY